MGIEFFTISFIMLLAVVTPGPDFILVTQNTLAHSKSKGVYTGLGIALSNVFHTSYCLLGLTVVMANSLLVFSIIKYLGAAYLIYMGVKALLAKKGSSLAQDNINIKPISNTQAILQGFLCNALNPKATLLFLSIFTVFITPETPLWVQLVLGVEITLFNFVWYALVSSFLTLPSIKSVLERVQYVLMKVMGAFMILFGIKLATLEK